MKQLLIATQLCDQKVIGPYNVYINYKTFCYAADIGIIYLQVTTHDLVCP